MNLPAPETPTVLVVDNEPMIRRLIGCFLRSRNVTVVEAGTGQEAVKLVRNEGVRPDLVIADLVMPQMGGIDLLQSLREDNEDMAALIVSGFWEDPTELERALNERTRFLGKPFNFKMLEVELNNLLPRTTLPPTVCTDEQPSV